MAEPQGYLMELTQQEALFLHDQFFLPFLVDRIEVFARASRDLEKGFDPITLIAKVGSAVLEHHPDGVDTGKHEGVIEVAFTAPEILAIREVAKSSVVVGEELVGLNLALKCYEAFRRLNSELPKDKGAEPEEDERMGRLQKFLKQEKGGDSDQAA